MPDQLRKGASSGDIAVFFLMAGVSPLVDSSVITFTISDHRSQTRDGVIRILNARAKPLACSARLVGPSVEITSETITSPEALRVRQQYLRLAARELVGLGGSPTTKGGEVLLKSEGEAMVVSTGLLRRFYDEYEIPHSSSQSQEDLVSNELFIAVVRVGPAGIIEAYMEEHRAGEEADDQG